MARLFAVSGRALGRGVGVGLRKDDAELKKMFDDAIQATIADGTLKKISEKYFGSDVSAA